MTDCAHPEFMAETSVHRLTDGDGGPVRDFVAELRIKCKACDLPFHFVGAPTGYAFKHPTVDVVATTLHAPIAPGERSLADLPSRLAFEAPPS